MKGVGGAGGAGWVFPVFVGAVSPVGGLPVGVVLFWVAAQAGAGVLAWHGMPESSGARLVSVRGPVNGLGGVVKHVRGVCHDEGGGKAGYFLVSGVWLVQGRMLVGFLAASLGACMKHSC
jgi:hypothetical protein